MWPSFMKEISTDGMTGPVFGVQVLTEAGDPQWSCYNRAQQDASSFVFLSMVFMSSF